MKVVRQEILPIGNNFGAINLFGILFVKKRFRLTQEILNHERIHTAQIREFGYIFFYVIYVLEWLYRLLANRFDYMKAYREISFEREAYTHQSDRAYLSRRRHYAMWRSS